MTDDLPGFSSQDTRRPPSKRELAAQDREYRALTLWYQTGDEAKVRDAMRLPSKGAARVLINRAAQRWHDEQETHVQRVRAMHDHLLLLSARRLAERIEEKGELQRIPDLIKVLDRHSKMHGIDAVKDDGPGGPQVIVIEARAPWERGETIDGESEDMTPPGLPSKT